MAKVKKPFNIKGRNIVTHLGEAEWCKIKKEQMETRFTPRGQYSVNLLSDPDDEGYLEFVAKVEEMIETAYNEAMNDEGGMKLTASKKKAIIKMYPFKEHIKKEKDEDGKYTIEEETGKMMIKCALKNVLDLPDRRNYVKVLVAGNKELPRKEVPEIGNGSKIKCKVYVNPYYMPSTNMIGVSLKLGAIKIYELVEYNSSGGEDFDDDGGADVDLTDSAPDEEDF